MKIINKDKNCAIVVALSCLLISYTGGKLHILAPIGALDNFKNQSGRMDDENY